MTHRACIHLGGDDSYYRSSDAILLVYDMTHAQSFLNLEVCSPSVLLSFSIMIWKGYQMMRVLIGLAIGLDGGCSYVRQTQCGYLVSR
jgi:hypothetical protein